MTDHETQTTSARALLDSIANIDPTAWTEPHQDTLDRLWDELNNWRPLHDIRLHLQRLLAAVKREQNDLPANHDDDNGVPIIP